MACGGTITNRPDCVDWEHAQKEALDLAFKTNSTTAQLNIERQIGAFNTNQASTLCVNEHTGLEVFAKDEFCRVVKNFQANNFVTDKKTNAEIDKFCK